MPKKSDDGTHKQVEIYVPDPEARAEVQAAIENGNVYFDISPREREVLKKVLDRNRTSMAVHGGLKSILVLTDEEASALLGFLERV
jgi:hypothetical protein